MIGEYVQELLMAEPGPSRTVHVDVPTEDCEDWMDALADEIDDNGMRVSFEEVAGALGPYFRE
jgi:hypothetical protein